MNGGRVIPLTVFLLGFIAGLVVRSWGSIIYVDLNSTNPTPPYGGWSTAATNIQDAVDLASNGDTVLVTNGVYSTGGHRWFDSGTNRLTLTNTVVVESVNGPEFTSIVGFYGAGTNAARC